MGEVMDRARALQDDLTSAITVVSLQDSGVTRYAIGGARGGAGVVNAELTEFFSDREVDLPADGPFRALNPFSKKNTDTSAISIDLDSMTAAMVLHTWGDAKFSFAVEDQGDVFFGVGDPVGGSSRRAYYMITLGTPQPPPR